MKLGYADAATYSLIVTRAPDEAVEDPDDPGVLSGQAKPIRVGDTLLWILRVVDPPGGGGPYLAPVVKASRGELRLRLVEDKLMPKALGSPAEVAEEIKRLEGQPGFADDWLDCTRQQ